jgi:hypothetical protein
MDQKINNKTILMCCSFLFFGIILGSVFTNLFKIEEKPETVKINYDSVCVKTLKAYYEAQKQDDKKKILFDGAKKMNLINKL